MASPEEKLKHRKRRMRIRSEIAKSLEDRKFRQRKIDNKKKAITKLSHKEFVDMFTLNDIEDK